MATFAEISVLSLADAAPFGGKVRGLVRLREAGARIPGGFAVAAGAWSEETRAEFSRRCAALLAGGPIAVRSSALQEDGSERSFAGLFESTLGVSDLDGALAAAERTLASGRGERVVAYAGQALEVGVLVQPMVAARAAGVAFTLDPDGADPALVLEAVAGVGEALMSGHADPQRWRVYRGGAVAPVARCAGGPKVIAEAEAVALAESAWSLAEKLGEPLDLEWATDAAGQLTWLQARPITVRQPYRPPHVVRNTPDADDGPVTVWANFNVRETMPEPLTPLNWDMWRSGVLPTLVAEFFGVPRESPLFHQVQPIDLIQGRAYWNMNAVLCIPFLGPVMLAGLPIVDSAASVALNRLHKEGVLQARRRQGSAWRILPAMLTSTLRFNLQLIRWMNPERSLEHIRRAGARQLARAPVGTMSEAELRQELHLFSAPENQDVRDGMQLLMAVIPVLAISMGLFRRDPDAQEALTWGVRDNPTTQISVAIERLAKRGAAYLDGEPDARDQLRALRERAGAEPELAEWIREFDAFLAQNGQRCPREFDIGVARWVETPELIFEHIRAAARSDAEGASARLERIAAERERLIGAAIARAWPWERPFMRFFARTLPRFMPLREAPKHEALRLFLRVRLAALELGRRLAARGQLAAAEDVFFLEFAELERTDDLRAIVAERAARSRAFSERPAADIVRSDGVPVEEEAIAEVGPDELSGIGVGRGRGEGPVVIPESPDPRLVRPGDVLVVKLADPAWTPLFPHAAAIIMEVGGTMCHAAVVARELGVPMLVSVRGATSRLRPGERVRVDAAAGRALRLDQR